MSLTIDSMNSVINNKLGYLTNIYDIYSEYTLDSIDNSFLAMYQDELNKLVTDYAFGSMYLLIEYYKPVENDKKKEIMTSYMSFITRENIIGRIDLYFQFCKKIHKSYSVEKEKVANLINLLDSEFIPTEKYEKKDTQCKCGSAYSINSKYSEFICETCGNMEKLYGVIFEDEQFYYQEGQRTKHCTYDPTKHCKFWIDCIQAKENKEIPVEHINMIKRCMKRDTIWPDELTCAQIRVYLKELKKTEYNDHIPLIRKIITRKEPAQFTDSELKLIYMYFSKIIQIYNQVKQPAVKPNSPYHPFFIYKIVEQIMTANCDLTRRNEILSSIHLQSQTTLVGNDNIWEVICEHIDEFKYEPTIRN